MATSWPRRSARFSRPNFLISKLNPPFPWQRKANNRQRCEATSWEQQGGGCFLQPWATVSGQNSPSNSLGLLRDSGDAISTISTLPWAKKTAERTYPFRPAADTQLSSRRHCARCLRNGRSWSRPVPPCPLANVSIPPESAPATTTSRQHQAKPRHFPARARVGDNILVDQQPRVAGLHGRLDPVQDGHAHIV